MHLAQQEGSDATLPALCYLNMTRTEAIAIITAKLASLDDGGLTVADIVQDMADPTSPTLDLTDAERAAIERLEDFKVGRTYRATSTRNIAGRDLHTVR